MQALERKTTYKCFSCDQILSSKVQLLQHLNTHKDGAIEIKCDNCKQMFFSTKAYEYHSKMNLCHLHQVPRYNCNECDKNFNNQRYYTRHLEGHKMNNCTHCSEKFSHRRHLKNHVLHVHNIREEACFQCSFCEQKYVKRKNLILHIAKNHAFGKYSCLECAAMFDSYEEHNSHVEEHARQKPFKCDRCNGKFSRKQQYLLHMKQHDKYECVSCNLSYADKERILEHKRKGHIIKGLTLRFKTELARKNLKSKRENSVKTLKSCESCNKTFTSEVHFNKHQQSHESKNNKDILFICEICGKQFDKKSTFETHVTSSHRGNQYSCDLCGHKCSTKTNLSHHMRLHLTHEKLFVCIKCGKSFYRLNTLKEHETTVHAEIPLFPCKICSKSFKRNSELLRHTATHSELRPYVCPDCGQSYKRENHLRRHQKSSHGKTMTKNRRVQRLIADANGHLVPLEKHDQSSNSNESSNSVYSLIDSNSQELTGVPDISNINIMNTQYNQELLDSYEEIWNDKSLPHLSDEYNQLDCTSENLINQASIQLDHIDTKDLIVLSPEQMISVEVVKNDQKNDLSISDYLKPFFID